jgi:hypothetical protein
MSSQVSPIASLIRSPVSSRIRNDMARGAGAARSMARTCSSLKVATIVPGTAGTRSRARGSTARYVSSTHQWLRTLRLRTRLATVAGRRPSASSAAHVRPASSVRSARVCARASVSSDER